MVSFLAIGALTTGVIALILLISLLLTGTMTFYPEVGQRAQLAASRVLNRASA